MVGHRHPLQMLHGDHIGVVDVNFLPEIGLKSQVGKLPAQLLYPFRRVWRQLGAHQIAVLAVIIDGRSVGQYHRRVELQPLLGDLRGEGAVGAAGGDGKPSALPDEIVDGRLVLRRHLQTVVI